MSVDEALGLLATLSDAERSRVFRSLRDEYRVPVHAIEAEWNITAERLLDAIHTATDFTQRGVRGVLAEAIFRTVVVPRDLQGWTSIPFDGDKAYDVLVEDGHGQVSIQVKNQRRDAGQPSIYKAETKKVGSTVYKVETQRTRNGKAKGQDGTEQRTRPYRFGAFDVLAVCMHASSGVWDDIFYCPQHLLLPHPQDASALATLQKLYSDGSRGWTRDFSVAASVVRRQKGQL